MKTYALLLVLGGSLFSFPSFAQENQDPNKIEIVTVDVNSKDAEDLSKLSREDQKRVLSELVHDAEEASEGGGDANKPKNKIAAFAKEYASKMNIPKVARGMYRWYNVMEGKYPSIAADLSIMLLASHTTEMLSGPIGVALASSSGAPDWLQWTIGVTGGVISIPGLDPLCIALGVAYVKIPKFRNGVTKTRLFMVKAATKVGADRFFNWFVQKQSRVDFIRNALEQEPGKYTYLLQPSDGIPGLSYAFKNKQGDVFARVDFEQDAVTQKVYASRATYIPEALASVTPREFSSMLGLFNTNVSMALTQGFKAVKNKKLATLEAEYHVIEVGENTLQFRPNALKLTDKRSWSDEFKSFVNCNILMRGTR